MGLSIEECCSIGARSLVVVDKQSSCPAFVVSRQAAGVCYFHAEEPDT